MSGERVQVVDDEARFRQTLATSLEGRGYSVKESPTGNDAIADFHNFHPDVVLLDLMLPDLDGISVCRELRRDSEVAIIVLSVTGDEATKVSALDEGADDYLTKPFGSDELLARMRAALRRSGTFHSDSTLVSGPLSLDPTTRLVLLHGEELHLTPTEFNLLRLLMANAGRVLRHTTILTTVWGEEYIEDTAILRTYINQLRNKLADEPAWPRFIRTEPGIGYRFISREV
jgi:two-component system KDP operon response regulator KdpE